VQRNKQSDPRYHRQPGRNLHIRQFACARWRPKGLAKFVPAAPWGYRKAKRLGGLNVYDHLKFSRHLNG
jgi:hypothetical protein